jgi:hypothetical protein
MRVRVSTRGGLAGSGRIDEASISGARLETALPLRVHSVIVLSLAAGARSTRHLKLEAEVVRRTERGFGIAWTQFAPARLRVLYRKFPTASRANTAEAHATAMRTSRS